MALSPKYGWAEPDNSSLVKNGAADIRTLGDAIDTSVWNVGFGQAGKNKIINGDFSINQRNFTTVTADGTFMFDRFLASLGTSGGTCTFSAQTFTAGTAPVAGYESRNFLQLVTASQSGASDWAATFQKIEDVRTFAGQTITISFWAKAATGTPNVGVTIGQQFGTGGSSAVISSPTVKAITTSWARYSFTVNVASIAGKTIGTGSHVQVYIFVSDGATLTALGYAATGLQNNTFQIWGLQVEAGSYATPFQTASGGSQQGELAMCQRYFVAMNSALNTSDGYYLYGVGYANATTNFQAICQLPVPMRTNPALTLDSATSTRFAIISGGGVLSCNAVPALSRSTTVSFWVSATVASGLTAGWAGVLTSNNNNLSYIYASAEL